MARKNRVESWEEWITMSLTIAVMAQVPEITEFAFTGLRLEEANSIALRNNLALNFLENRINDLPGLFQFRKKERS